MRRTVNVLENLGTSCFGVVGRPKAARVCRAHVPDRADLGAGRCSCNADMCASSHNDPLGMFCSCIRWKGELTILNKTKLVWTQAWKNRMHGLDFPLNAPLAELCTRLLLNPYVLGVSGTAGALASLLPAFRAESNLASFLSATQAPTVTNKVRFFRISLTTYGIAIGL